MNDREVEEAARTFALLGDPTRLRIVRTLMTHGELSVHETAELARASRFNTSAHLGRLAAGGLVARRRVGTTVYYRIDDAHVVEMCDAVCASLRGRAAASAALDSVRL